MKFGQERTNTKTRSHYAQNPYINNKMNLPKPSKAIQHLRNKVATKQSFYITDFDKACMESIITFYNVIEDEIKQDFSIYYKLIYIFIRYEIVNNRLNENEQMTIKDIFNHIEKLLSSDIESEAVKMLLEANSQKKVNFEKSGEELNIKNVSKTNMTEVQDQQALDMINEFVTFRILKQQKQ